MLLFDVVDVDVVAVDSVAVGGGVVDDDDYGCNSIFYRT